MPRLPCAIAKLGSISSARSHNARASRSRPVVVGIRCVDKRLDSKSRIGVRERPYRFECPTRSVQVISAGDHGHGHTVSAERDFPESVFTVRDVVSRVRSRVGESVTQRQTPSATSSVAPSCWPPSMSAMPSSSSLAQIQPPAATTDRARSIACCPWPSASRLSTRLCAASRVSAEAMECTIPAYVCDRRTVTKRHRPRRTAPRPSQCLKGRCCPRQISALAVGPVTHLCRRPARSRYPMRGEVVRVPR